jgi:hypothetical protein
MPSRLIGDLWSMTSQLAIAVVASLFMLLARKRSKAQRWLRCGLTPSTSTRANGGAPGAFAGASARHGCGTGRAHGEQQGCERCACATAGLSMKVGHGKCSRVGQWTARAQRRLT